MKLSPSRQRVRGPGEVRGPKNDNLQPRSPTGVVKDVLGLKTYAMIRILIVPFCESDSENSMYRRIFPSLCFFQLEIQRQRVVTDGDRKRQPQVT
jgi:hypothetical protein